MHRLAMNLPNGMFYTVLIRGVCNRTLTPMQQTFYYLDTTHIIRESVVF